jgi:nucleotide-binding universal stress UspA family protein
MYKHILIAVDGSEATNLALQETLRLAKGQDAQLRLIHVMDESPASLAMADANLQDAGLIEDLNNELRKSGEDIMSAAAAVVRRNGIEPETLIKKVNALGPGIAEVIEEEATSWPADLIVIGTHGRRGVRRLLLGSVAEGVVRIATKPVLLVRLP